MTLHSDNLRPVSAGPTEESHIKAFGRNDISALSNWWWTIDRVTLFCLILLIALSFILSLGSSPAAAGRIGQGLDSLGFAKKQLIFLPLAMAVMISVSFLSIKTVRRLCVFALCIGLLSLVFVLLGGEKLKGAQRWIRLPGFLVQPSEFIKPVFIVITAWFLSAERSPYRIPGTILSLLLTTLIIGLLILQPDLGQSLLILAIFVSMLFLFGLDYKWVVGAGAIILSFFFIAYKTLSHVQDRISSFLEPGFQLRRSKEAFQNGGFIGRGPGEGRIKDGLPDVHSDFIFAVAGEEFGILFCFILVCLFSFIIIRGLRSLRKEKSLFIMLASAGILIQFGLQAWINMSSTLGLIPTKGMTLPFLSYGGSSMLSIAFGMGIYLSFTRRRVEGDYR